MLPEPRGRGLKLFWCRRGWGAPGGGGTRGGPRARVHGDAPPGSAGRPGAARTVLYLNLANWTGSQCFHRTRPEVEVSAPSPVRGPTSRAEAQAPRLGSGAGRGQCHGGADPPRVRRGPSSYLVPFRTKYEKVKSQWSSSHASTESRSRGRAQPGPARSMAAPRAGAPRGGRRPPGCGVPSPSRGLGLQTLPLAPLRSGPLRRAAPAPGQRAAPPRLSGSPAPGVAGGAGTVAPASLGSRPARSPQPLWSLIPRRPRRRLASSPEARWPQPEGGHAAAGVRCAPGGLAGRAEATGVSAERPVLGKQGRGVQAPSSVQTAAVSRRLPETQTCRYPGRFSLGLGEQ